MFEDLRSVDVNFENTIKRQAQSGKCNTPLDYGQNRNTKIKTKKMYKINNMPKKRFK